MNKKQGQRSRKDSANLCVVCCEEYEFYAIGSCDHAVCFRCCVRMRVLGNEKYCPVCRTDLDKVNRGRKEEEQKYILLFFILGVVLKERNDNGQFQ